MSDAALLGRSLRGDAEAFRLLYDRHAEPVYSYALRVVGNRAAAEDVVQDVFLAILKRGGSYDPSRAFLPWLLAITRNAAIDQRRAGARPEIGFDPALLELPSEAPSGTEADDVLEEGLARLPREFREALWLCDAMGLSYDAAGTILHCEPGTIGSRISRARRLLREHFTRNGHAL